MKLSPSFTSISLRRVLLFVFSLSVLSLHCGGSASPPASIPAPVSSLMSASAPDANGNTTITGQAGSVEGSATVEAANLTRGGTLSWFSFFFKKAYARPNVGTETQPTTTSTTADSQGAFSITLGASSGDIIGVRQTVNGVKSDTTRITVP